MVTQGCEGAIAVFDFVGCSSQDWATRGGGGAGVPTSHCCLFYRRSGLRPGEAGRGRLGWCDGLDEVTAPWETLRDGWEVSLRPHVEDQVHTDHDVEQEVAMEEPVTGVVSPKSEDDVSVVGDGNGVLCGRKVELPVEETSPVEIESVFQVDLLDVLVRRSAHTDDVEGVTVKMERMTKVRLLDFIYEYNLDDGVLRNINLVCAHAISSAVSGLVVAVTEGLWWDVFDLGNWWGVGESEGNLID